jgi:histidine ammonia-lyase
MVPLIQELNSVTDNPLLFFNDATGELEDVISGGNFHGEVGGGGGLVGGDEIAS